MRLNRQNYYLSFMDIYFNWFDKIKYLEFILLLNLWDRYQTYRNYYLWQCFILYFIHSYLFYLLLLSTVKLSSRQVDMYGIWIYLFYIFTYQIDQYLKIWYFGLIFQVFSPIKKLKNIILYYLKLKIDE